MREHEAGAREPEEVRRQDAFALRERREPREATYTTLMMATGLTFGTISSLYGLTHGYIDNAQYSALVTTVILSAVVPTFIAEAAFPPKENAGEAESGGLEEVEVG